jgi:hypothetical protein
MFQSQVFTSSCSLLAIRQRCPFPVFRSHQRPLRKDVQKSSDWQRLISRSMAWRTNSERLVAVIAVSFHVCIDDVHGLGFD